MARFLVSKRCITKGKRCLFIGEGKRGTKTAKYGADLSAQGMEKKHAVFGADLAALASWQLVEHVEKLGGTWRAA